MKILNVKNLDFIYRPIFYHITARIHLRVSSTPDKLHHQLWNDLSKSFNNKPK